MASPGARRSIAVPVRADGKGCTHAMLCSSDRGGGTAVCRYEQSQHRKLDCDKASCCEARCVQACSACATFESVCWHAPTRYQTDSGDWQTLHQGPLPATPCTETHAHAEARPVPVSPPARIQNHVWLLCRWLFAEREYTTHQAYGQHEAPMPTNAPRCMLPEPARSPFNPAASPSHTASP